MDNRRQLFHFIALRIVLAYLLDIRRQGIKVNRRQIEQQLFRGHGRTPSERIDYMPDRNRPSREKRAGAITLRPPKMVLSALLEDRKRCHLVLCQSQDFGRHRLCPCQNPALTAAVPAELGAKALKFSFGRVLGTYFAPLRPSRFGVGGTFSVIGLLYFSAGLRHAKSPEFVYNYL